jgi:hypothetical protein
MVKKLLTPLFTSVLAFSLSMPGFAQEGSKQEGAKTPVHKPAEKEKAAKEARWDGIITRNSKDKSTLSVRQRSSNVEKTIHYDSSTQWISQEHLSRNTKMIDASQVKDGDRVICLGTYDEKGEFHATLISKRLSK